MLQAVDVPVDGGPGQVGCGVLMDRDAVAIALGTCQRGIEQPPRAHAIGAGQVRVANGKAEERATIPCGFGMTHARKLEIVEHGQVGGGLVHLVGHLPEVYVGRKMRQHALVCPLRSRACVRLDPVGGFAVGRVYAADDCRLRACLPQRAHLVRIRIHHHNQARLPLLEQRQVTVYAAEDMRPDDCAARLLQASHVGQWIAVTVPAISAAVRNHTQAKVQMRCFIVTRAAA